MCQYIFVYLLMLGNHIFVKKMEVKREKGFHDYYKIFTDNQKVLSYYSYKITLKHLDIGLNICIHENIETIEYNMLKKYRFIFLPSTLPILLNEDYKIWWTLEWCKYSRICTLVNDVLSCLFSTRKEVKNRIGLRSGTVCHLSKTCRLVPVGFILVEKSITTRTCKNQFSTVSFLTKYKVQCQIS